MFVTPEKTSSPSRSLVAQVVLTGNPNCGKTTLFNALTGLRAKVGNYAGVTVERKEGRMLGLSAEKTVTILDLPGTYSLSPQSLDERISRDVLLNHLPEVPPPDLVIVVVDASNLERNLYYATQMIELGYPTLMALNMIDVAEQNGHFVQVERLAKLLRIPVFPIVASTGTGLLPLREAVLETAFHVKAQTGHNVSISEPKAAIFCDFPTEISDEIERIMRQLGRNAKPRVVSLEAEALLLLTDDKFASEMAPGGPLRDEIEAARQRLEGLGHDWRSFAIEARYQRIGSIHHEVVTESGGFQETFSDKLDRILTHRFLGSSDLFSDNGPDVSEYFYFRAVAHGFAAGRCGMGGRKRQSSDESR